jgi:hypothetical protein
MRLFLRTLLLWLMLAAPSFAAGTIPFAMQQQVDINGKPLAGCLLYIFQAGTVSTPQAVYSDFGLTQQAANPLQCDQTGRVPMFWLADGTVHARLTDAAGVVVSDVSVMQVLGPSSGGGGGGGGTVDPTTIMATGDVKFRPTQEVLTGWVRLNGLTIGSAISGATGRANADTQNLYVYLWGICDNTHCPVSSGRGASALADFNANKTITLPDWRGRGPFGFDGMGNGRAGVMSDGRVTSGADTADTAFASGGNQTVTLSQGNLPNVTLSTTIAAGQGSHTHNKTLNNSNTAIAMFGGTGGNQTTASGGLAQYSGDFTISNATLPQMTGTTPLGGSGTAVDKTPPFILGTWHIKLATPKDLHICDALTCTKVEDGQDI